MYMKHINSLVIFTAVILVTTISSCRKDGFDHPPVIIPKFEIPAGAQLKSIAQLKAMHDPASASLDSVKEDIIVQGILISSDSSGNMYKYIVIQDTSGGLMINIDNSSLYLDYKLGQKLYIKCKNLVLGSYGGMTQLGVINDGSIGRIPDAVRKNYIFKDGLALRSNMPAPKEVTAFNQLANPATDPKDLCKLVKLKNVCFADSGAVYSLSTSSTSRNILDSTSAVIVARNSNYALFAGSTLPVGKGTVVGIFTYYSYTSTPQLVIRDLNDVYDFH